MKRILVQAMGGLSEKRLARLIELELTERDVEALSTAEGDIDQAIFVVGALDEETAEAVREIAPDSEKLVCCRYVESETDGLIVFERPLDAGKLCDGLLRHQKREKDSRGLEIHGDTVTFRSEKLELSRKELELLKLLASKNGEVLSRSEAKDKIFPSENDGNVVDVYISYLRRKLDRRFDVRTIVTVRNKGYMLKK